MEEKERRRKNGRKERTRRAKKNEGKQGRSRKHRNKKTMIAETIGIEHTPRQKTGSHAQTQKQNTTRRNIRTNSQNHKKNMQQS